MPAFNAASTIERSVRTTLKALPRDAEIAIWDDASADHTAEVVERIADKRIKVHRSESNVGGGNARNALIGLTDSEFIASMDADDLCLPWRFSVQVRELSSADITFSPAIRFNPDTKRIRFTSPIPLNEREVPVALLFHNPLFHPSMFAKRSALNAVGGYRDMRVAQDYDLWLRAASAGVRLTRSAVPAICYRESASQVSSSSSYRARIVAEDRLASAYTALLAQKVGSSTEYLSTLASLQVEEVIRGLLVQLRGPAKRYYSSLLDSHRVAIPIA